MVSLVRLVGEVRELGENAAAWGRHALEGLLRLCDARAGSVLEHWAPCDLEALAARAVWRVSDEARTARARKRVYAAQRLGLGYESRGAERAVDEAFWDQATNPAWASFRPAVARAWVRTRGELVDDRTWQRSPHFERLRDEGKVGEYMVSHQPVPMLRALHTICLFRGPDEPPFTADEAARLGVFHGELGRAWRAAPSAVLATLSPRQAVVLRLLLRGKREKELADDLRTTPSTAHQYVMSLYRLLAVSSRGELAARVADLERQAWPRLAGFGGQGGRHNADGFAGQEVPSPQSETM